MEEVKNNTGQNLGIAALITAIITFVLAVIPCVGLIAIIPGIIAIVLASVGLSQATRNNSPRGVLLAGLIIADNCFDDLSFTDICSRKDCTDTPANGQTIFRILLMMFRIMLLRNLKMLMSQLRLRAMVKKWK